MARVPIRSKKMRGGVRMVDPLAESSAVKDSVVIITGGARGVGGVLARRFSGVGAKVVIADLLQAEGESLASELRGLGAETFFHTTDVSSEQSLANLVKTTYQRYGRIDALINNAAIYQGLGRKQEFTDIPVSEWDAVMTVNVKGTWLASRAVYPVMKAQKYGRIVNVASSAVYMGVPFFAHYVASKGAVIALTRCLASEVGRDGLTVNAIAPGLIDNESSRKLGSDDSFLLVAEQRAVPRGMVPDDVVGAVMFLCSSRAGFVTGQTLIVDGGAVFS